LNELLGRADCAHFGAQNPLICKAQAGQDNTYAFGSSVSTSTKDAQADCVKTANAIEGLTEEITQRTHGFPGKKWDVHCFLNIIYVKEANQTKAQSFADAFSELINVQDRDEFWGCEVTTQVRSP
jgi:hypothetical protein